MPPHAHRSPSTAAIGLLGCLGGLLTWALIAVASATAGQLLWTWAAGAALLICLVAGGLCLVLVRARGFYHDPPPGEGEGGGGDGGSRPEPPPPGSSGGGGLGVDWDRFLSDFWSYVAEHERALSTSKC